MADRAKADGVSATPWPFAIILFVLVWASCSWFGSWEMNTNNAVRLYAAISLVEDGDATIDDFDSATIDKARVGDHLYLDKAPGMSLLALPAVEFLHVVSPRRSKDLTKTFYDLGFADFIRARTRLAVATGPALLTALAAVLLFDLALALTGGAQGALVAALGYALGTPAWGWSTTLLGHAPVAALLVIAVWCGRRAVLRRGAIVAAFCAGCALGFAVTIEYQAVLAGSVVAVWIAWSARRHGDRTTIIWSALGGVAGLAPLAAYNLIAYGTVFRLGYQGVVGFAGMDRGLFGIGWPDPAVLWNIVFSLQRGLLIYAPVMAVAAVGLVRMIRDPAARGLGIAISTVCIVTLLVHAGYYYWDGGNATGPRLSIPLVGVAALGIAYCWDAMARPAWRCLIAAVLIVSIAINAMIAATEIYAVPTLAFPLREAVIGPFLNGYVRTIASDYLGVAPRVGFVAWSTSAFMVIALLSRYASRIQSRLDRRQTR